MEIAFVGSTLAEALGWTILHSLWQGFAIFLLLSFGLRMAHRLTPQFRYRLCVGALVALSLWVFYTFFSYYTQLKPGFAGGVSEFGLEHPMIAPLPATFYETSIWIEAYMLFQQFIQLYARELAAVWLLGALLFLLRWVGSMYFTYQLRRVMTVPAMDKWQQSVGKLSQKLGVKNKVGLWESARVEVPLVIGHFKPVILFPIGMMSGLSPIQVEAIIAHELAHVKRNDFLVNLILSVVEILFFYHPVYWWLSAKVQDEREHCCDDMAVGVTGNPKAYAEALVEMESLLQTPSLGLALQGRKNHLLSRIKRICLGEREIQRSEPGKVGFSLCLLLAIAFFAWFQLPAQEEPEFEEGLLEEVWEELALEETDGFEEEFFPELEEVPIPETPSEIEELPLIERISPLMEILSRIDTRIDSPNPLLHLPPMPPMPPLPQMSIIPPLPPMPAFPSNVEDLSPEERETFMEEFKLNYREWEGHYKERYREWEEDFKNQYQEWEQRYKERFQEYEERVKEYSERYGESTLRREERQQMEWEIQRQLMESQDLLNKEQMLLQTQLQRELHKKEQEMRLQQMELQSKLQQMQLRLQQMHEESSRRSNSRGWGASNIEGVQGSETCGEKLRAAMREDGFERESKKKLNIEIYKQDDQSRIRINGVPYAPKLSSRWIKALKDCGMEVDKINHITFSHTKKGQESVQMSYEVEDEMLDHYFDFHKEMTRELFKDKLIPSPSKKWRIAVSNDKLLLNGKKFPEDLEPKYRKILKNYGQDREFLRMKYNPSAEPGSRAD